MTPGRRPRPDGGGRRGGAKDAPRTLRLRRPLAFVDTETTGPNPAHDRIVEIVVVRLEPDGRREVFETRVNPGVAIPAEVIKIHGITDEDVEDMPPFAAVAPRVAELFEGADIAGFGIRRFDVEILEREFARAGHSWSRGDRRLVDSMTIFHMRERRNLTAAYRFYCGKSLDGAHSARADVEAAIEVLHGQIARYPDLPADVDGLHALCQQPRLGEAIDPEGKFVWRDGEAFVSFGIHRGRPLRDVARDAPDYLRWITESDFTHEVRDIAAAALKGKFPQKA